MSRALVILALALLASAALAVDVFPVRGEPATFPGNGANFPQDRGAPTKTGQFVNQAEIAGSPFPFAASHIAAGSPYADGLGGAFRGQIVGAGVDPVRGVFRTARNGWGHSGGSAPIYRGGRGGGSGDGYHTAQTRLPERGDVNGFITERSLPEQFDDASSLSASVVSMIVALVAAFALFF